MYTANPKKVDLYLPLLQNIQAYTEAFSQIPDERRGLLKKLAQFIEHRADAGEKAELIFICTHNSRRSHISQIWAQAAAAYFGLSNVICYSGGTEATAFNPRAVTAMEDAGFRIRKKTEGDNPVYEVGFADNSATIEAFSKKYDGGGNPKNGFAAVMTCSHADQNCPLVAGAAARIPLTYDDPKDFDGTPLETEKYRERVREIGTEILFAFSLIK